MRHDSRKYGKQSTHAESTKKSGRPSTHPLLTISGEGYFSISKLQSRFDDSVEGLSFYSEWYRALLPYKLSCSEPAVRCVKTIQYFYFTQSSVVK